MLFLVFVSTLPLVAHPYADLARSLSDADLDRALSALRAEQLRRHQTTSMAVLEPAPKVCVVAGVGPGLGEHAARRFAAGGCRVALLARDAARLANISASILGSRPYSCDVTDSKLVAKTFAAIQADLGDVDALIYNVGGGPFRPFDNITGSELEDGFRGNVLGLLLTAQQVGPEMAKRGHGVIGVTGATSSWRSLPTTAGFAPGKFASRGLAESLARQLGPKGVHVFHAVIDGGISSNRTSKMAMHPADIAEAYYNLALQPRSAWTFELSVFAWADTTWYSI